MLSAKHGKAKVSSLYGRVYHLYQTGTHLDKRFLPVWEGVSVIRPVAGGGSKFPPCMGGCIVHIKDFLKNLAAHSRDFSHELAASLNSLFQ